MIHAYNEQLMPTVRDKLAQMFELAVYVEGIGLDDFAGRFIKSRICGAFEKADPVYVLGKSANELAGMVLDGDPIEADCASGASPEYWTGWALAYTQWYMNRPYRELLHALSCRELCDRYFPYHEMDVSRSVELFRARLPKINPLKKLRKERGFSQADLAKLSGVPERTIRAYEQGKLDIARAQAESLYSLSQTLGCKIEDLILPR